MSIFKIQAPDGRTVTLEGDTQPSEQELDGIFQSLPPSQAPAAVPSSSPEVANRLKDYFNVPGAQGGEKTALGLTKGLVSIPAAYANQALYNLPRAITHQAGYEYPAPSLGEKETINGQPIPGEAIIGSLSKLAGGAGLVQSPFNKLDALKVFGKTKVDPYNAALKSVEYAKGIPGFLGKVGDASISGAAMGGAYSPDNPLDIKARLQQALGGSIAGPVLKGAARGLTTGTGKLVRELSGISTKSIKALRELGPENVFKPNLEKTDYLTKELRPQAEKMTKNEAIQMNPKTMKELGMDQATIDQLGQMTPDEISQARFGGSVGDLSFETKQALQNKVDASEKQFADTLNAIPEGQKLRLNNFRSELSKQLKGMFQGGKLRKDIPKGDTKHLKEFIDMYLDKRDVLNKGAFLARRSRLNHIITSQAGTPNEAMAQALKEALDTDAVEFGFKGLKEAKMAYKQGKEFGPFINKLSGEKGIGSRKLAKEMTPEDQRSLQALEQYLGKAIIKPATHINAVQELDDLIAKQISDKTQLSNKVESAMRGAQEESVYTGKEKTFGRKGEELTRLLGNKDKAIATLRNLSANRLAQEMSPKGFSMSRSGRMKGGARAVLRAYEEGIRPGLQKTGANVENAKFAGTSLRDFFKMESPSLKKS